MRHRTLTALSILLLAFLAAGCGSDPDTPNSSSDQAVERVKCDDEFDIEGSPSSLCSFKRETPEGAVRCFGRAIGYNTGVLSCWPVEDSADADAG